MKTQIIKSFVLLMSQMFAVPAFANIIGSHFFSDTAAGNLDYVYSYLEMEDGIILTGSLVEANTEEPIILKVDVNGDIVWSTSGNTVLGTESVSRFPIELMNDGFVYGSSRTKNSSNTWHNTLWKIDPSTGKIIWTNIHPTIYHGGNNLTDYDSISFLTTGLINNTTALYKIDKATGNTLDSGTVTGYNEPSDIAVDADKNIYYSENYTVRKLNQDDFAQELWARNYDVIGNDELYVHLLYVDYLGDLYVFGRNGGSWGHGVGLILKVDVGTGDEIWEAYASEDEVSIADFKDYNSKIYATFKHTLVGGGTYKFRSAQVDKETGNVDWLSNESPTPLGSPSSHSGGCEAALSIDVDCDGDVYQTGYYGDANYGPEQWGIMKISGIDGKPEFDLTITKDPLSYDNYSVGIASCVIGNTPIFIGREEDTSASFNVNPVFVSVDPNNGSVTKKKYLADGSTSESRTLDIINYNDSLYVLKQQGRYLTIEQYDSNESLLWSEIIGDSSKIIGGHMKVLNDHVYFTATRGILSTTSQSNLLETDQIILGRLERQTGTLVDYDTLSFSGVTITMLELEAETDKAFLFYEYNGKIYFNKWTTSGIGTENLFQNAGVNASHRGKLNIVENHDTNNFFILGSNAVYTLNKNTLTPSIAVSYNSERNYYHMLKNDSMLFLAGNDVAGNQVMTAINWTNMSVSWDESYSSDGVLIKTVSNGKSNLWTVGSNNDYIEVHEINMFNGDIVWTYRTAPANYGETEALDFALHPTNNYLTIAGTQKTGMDSGNVIIDFVDLFGSSINTIVSDDDMGLSSQANTIALLGDSSIWVGGSLNQFSKGKVGFIHTILNTKQIATGLNPADEFLNVEVYPNPTSGIVTVDGPNKLYQIEVFDFVGRNTLNKKAVGKSRFNLSDFTSGMYVVSINIEGSQKSFKVVKQ